MTKMEVLPVSGYILDRVYTNEQYYRIPEPPPGNSTAAAEGNISFGWDWQIIDEHIFEVSVRISLNPSQRRWEEAGISLQGRFTIAAETPTIPVVDFVKLQGPAILLPYARETLASLTGHGFYGTRHLPPLNVVRLMKSQPYEASTGAQQLSRGAVLRYRPALPGNASKK